MDQTTTQHCSPKTHKIIFEQNVPLHDKNWFQTGGTAKFLCQPTSPEQISYALLQAKELDLPILFLGDGANILISDEGFNGLVIKPASTKIEFKILNKENILVTVGAGTLVSELITSCLAHNALGLEEFSGIPGTVGGAVYINMHYFEFRIGQFLFEAKIVNRSSGTITTVGPEWFNFGYDSTTLHDQTHYLASATFKFRRGSNLEVSYANGRRVEIIRHRNSRYPTSGTCGSFFRNFHQHEVGVGNIPHVAYYLDKLGVRGTLRCGGACVSHKHANMIVNDGTATSTDIANLARQMQTMMKEKFGFTPQPECSIAGFKEYPLIQI